MVIFLPTPGREAVPLGEMTSFSFLAGLRGGALGLVLLGGLPARGATLPPSPARLARLAAVGLKPSALQLLHPDGLHGAQHVSNPDA